MNLLNISEYSQLYAAAGRRNNLSSLHDTDMQYNGTSSSSFHYYPNINLKNDIFSTSSHKTACLNTSARSVLIPVSETVLKRVIRTFFENGLRSALDEARNEESATQLPILSKTADWVVRLLDYYENLRIKVFPYAQKLDAENIAKFVETRDWLNSPIRFIEWHPHCIKLAVAGADDIVRLYGQTPNVVSVLKCTGQKDITCLAWRPYSPSEIVVGCRAGLYHWTNEGNSNITRSTWQSQVYKHLNGLPVTSIQWNASGTLLATGSIGDRSILIWELDSLNISTVRRFGPPCSLLKWSSHSSLLFSATVGKTFRVWDCDNYWEPERWLINEGTIQTACWSPCETFLLFATTTEPILYRLDFEMSNLFMAGSDSRFVLPIADLNESRVGDTIVGGLPQQIVWDPSGRYIVITFKHTKSIVLFRTLVQKFDLQMSPACYISGQNDTEYPNFVCFENLHFRNNNTVLTIGWSSGRVEFCPLDEKLP